MDISLNSHEARVFGVLIEKAFTTPDQYPLSLNATTNGCNQKSNRDPVVDFSEAEVRIALQGLQIKGLIGGTRQAGSRVEKYRHNAPELLKVSDRAIAVVAELLLRGPQSAGEIRGRAKRMRDLPDLGALEEALGELQASGFVAEVPGGRTTKYRQLLCGTLHPDGDEGAAPRAPVKAPGGEAPLTVPPPEGASRAAAMPLEARVEALEAQVSGLTETVTRLVRELGS